jgi:hypothetical protein
VVIFIFLRTDYKVDTVKNKMKRVDLGGNAMLALSLF